MERPLPFQPTGQRHPNGWLLSLALHMALALVVLLYALQQPVLPLLPAVLPVELVAVQPQPGPSASRPSPRTGAPAPRVAATPRPLEGVRPDAAVPADELTARLQALSRLGAPDGPLTLDNGGSGAGGGGGALSLRDFIRAQIMRRWLPNLGTRARRDRPVLLRVTVTARGVITAVEILDRQQFDGDRLFRGLTTSARNAALLSSPVMLPPGNWPAVNVVDIALDPKDASR
jgi:hypothetical protein